MKFSSLLAAFCAIGLAAGATVAEAALTQNWRIDSVSGSSLDLGTDSTNRGLAYNPVTNNVLVANNSSTTPLIRIYNANTGAFVGNMDMTGVAGSATVVPVKLRVVDYGSGNYAVFANSIATNTRSGSIVLWRWFGSASQVENTVGAPSVIYRNRAANSATPEASPIGPFWPEANPGEAERSGDAMDIRVVSGTTVEFYIGRLRGLRADSVAKLTYVDPVTASAGSVSSVSNISLTGVPTNLGFGTATSVGGIGIDQSNGDIYLSTRSVGFHGRFNNSGVFQELLTGTYASAGHPRIGTLAGRKLMAYIHDQQPTNGAGSYYRFGLVDITSGVLTGQLTDFTPNSLFPAQVNSNATGDVAFDSVGNRLFVLTTNHYFGSYTFAANPAGVTKTWDNGGADGSWFTAANWSPDGVPTFADNVVLDNSLVGGPYTVTIGASATEAAARSITIGDGTANRIQLTLAATNLNRQAMTITGTGDSFVIGTNGQFNYSSGTGGGTVVHIQNQLGNVLVKTGGIFFSNTPRSFSGPFPPAFPTTGGFTRNLNGAITFQSGSEAIFDTQDTFGLPGRTYGTLRLQNRATAYAVSSGNQPASIDNFDVPASAALGVNLTMGAPLRVGTFTKGSATVNTFNLLPMIFDSSLTLPAAVSLTGETLVTTGTTLTIANNTIIGATNTGRGMRVAGSVVVNGGATLTVNGYLAPFTGSSISGGGAIAYGANGGVGTDKATGIPSGGALPEITVSTPGTVPASASGVFAYIGTSDQALGSHVNPAGVGGIVLVKPSYAKLIPGANLQVNNVLSLTTGVLDMGANVVTLGTSAAANGTLTFPISGGLIKGQFRRWLAAAAAANDFPLIDSQNRTRFLTINRVGAATTGGHLTASFVEGPVSPVTFTALNPGANGGTVLTANNPIEKADQQGVYRLIPGGGFAAGTQTADFILDVDGFNVGQDGTRTTIVSRDIGGPAWLMQGTTPIFGATSLTRGFNSYSNFSIINFEAGANPIRAIRRNAFPTASAFPVAGIELAVGGPSDLVPVSLSDFSAE